MQLHKDAVMASNANAVVQRSGNLQVMGNSKLSVDWAKVRNHIDESNNYQNFRGKGQLFKIILQSCRELFEQADRLSKEALSLQKGILVELEFK